MTATAWNCLRTFPVKKPFESRLQFIRMGKYGDGILSYMYTKTTQYAKISDSRIVYSPYLFISHASGLFINKKRTFFSDDIYVLSWLNTGNESLRLSAFEFISLYHQILLDLKTVSRHKYLFRLQIYLTLMISSLVLYKWLQVRIIAVILLILFCIKC